jgi:hypothetical protein
MLGKSLREKEEIEKEFRRIYEVRSRIVHRGDMVLDEEDSKCLDQLENFTKLLIKDTIFNFYSKEDQIL